jgi:hypothetical protein
VLPAAAVIDPRTPPPPLSIWPSAKKKDWTDVKKLGTVTSNVAPAATLISAEPSTEPITDPDWS